MMRFLVFPSAIASIVLCLAGCGEPEIKRVPVGGIVFIDRVPLEGGTIRFVPEVGRPGSSIILSDGSFAIAAESVDHPAENGLLPGKYLVQVSSSEIVDDETIHWKAPEHYADFRTSGLEVVIDEANEALLIDLVSEGIEDDGGETPSKTPADAQLKEAKKS